jgi:hypothetical protein
MLSAADYRHGLGEWDTLSARRGTPTIDTDGAQVLLVGGRFSRSVNNAGAASARYARSGVHGAGRTASAHTPRAGVRLDDVVRFTDRHHGGMASATGPDHRVGSPEEEERSPPGAGALSLARASIPPTEEENADLRAIPRNRHVCLEEGTLAGWLYEVLEPHVEELVVTGVRRSRGPKSDKVDAFALAEQLRIGSLETRVYKGRGKFGRLPGRVAGRHRCRCRARPRAQWAPQARLTSKEGIRSVLSELRRG